MAHNLTRRANGAYEAIFGRGMKAWHNLVEPSEGMFTADQVQVLLFPFQFVMERIPNKYTDENTRFNALYRSDTGEMVSVGMSDNYSITQPSDLLLFMEIASGNPGAEHYDTAGILNECQDIWAQIYRGNMDIRASGDIHNKYLLGTTNYSASARTKFKDVTMRVVCDNTHSQALRNRGFEMEFPHTAFGDAMRDYAMQVFGASESQFATMQETLEELAGRSVTTEMVQKVFEQMFIKKDSYTSKEAENVKKKMDEVGELFLDNDDNTFPQFAGSAYALYNAFTNYADHYWMNRNRRDAEVSAVMDCLLGDKAKFKEEALEVVYELTNGAQTMNAPRAYSFQTKEFEVDGSSVLDDILSNN